VRVSLFAQANPAQRCCAHSAGFCVGCVCVVIAQDDTCLGCVWRWGWFKNVRSACACVGSGNTAHSFLCERACVRVGKRTPFGNPGKAQAVGGAEGGGVRDGAPCCCFFEKRRVNQEGGGRTQAPVGGGCWNWDKDD
jgi:hypothetical protein